MDGNGDDFGSSLQSVDVDAEFLEGTVSYHQQRPHTSPTASGVRMSLSPISASNLKKKIHLLLKDQI